MCSPLGWKPEALFTVQAFRRPASYRISRIPLRFSGFFLDQHNAKSTP
jgi:hypothetical protein